MPIAARTHGSGFPLLGLPVHCPELGWQPAALFISEQRESNTEALENRNSIAGARVAARDFYALHYALFGEP